MWARDHTIWKDDPTEIADRLGWLDAPERFNDETRDLVEFGRKARAGGDINHVVVCGMGGSVFACEMFDRGGRGRHPAHGHGHNAPRCGQGAARVVGPRAHALRRVLEVGDDRRDAIAPRVLLVAGGSGRQVRRRHRSRHASSRRWPANAASSASSRTHPTSADGTAGCPTSVSSRRRCPASTSSRSSPEHVARWSTTHRVLTRCTPQASVWARRMGEAILRESRDKLTFVLPAQLASFGVLGRADDGRVAGQGGQGRTAGRWVKHSASPDRYGPDRIFCSYTLGASRLRRSSRRSRVSSRSSGSAWRTRRPWGPRCTGGRWRPRSSVTSLDINPFDQPDVEAAKVRAREALQRPPGERPDPGRRCERRCGTRATPLHRDPGVPAADVRERRAPRAPCGRRLRDRHGVRGHRRVRPPLPPLDRAVPQGGAEHGRVPSGHRTSARIGRRGSGYGLLVRPPDRRTGGRRPARVTRRRSSRRAVVARGARDVGRIAE